MDTLETLGRKFEGAEDLKSVVRTMKAMAASKIVQYEQAVTSLDDYYRTVALGLVACFRQEKMEVIKEEPKRNKDKVICAIVFGSDQGLVGQFNDKVTNFVAQSLKVIPGKKEIWAVGERVQLLLLDNGSTVTKLFPVPNSVNAITPLVAELLIKSEESREKDNVQDFYIFHNQPKAGAGYEPVIEQLLPLDEKWKQKLAKLQWPTKTLPQVAGAVKPVLLGLIREYLFVSLFKACTESLASENTSRLEAMQRAEKNIEELLADLGSKFNRLRQDSIDEELFDIVSGFEAMKEETKKILGP
jgi:F-type H+-transporting ATPase subunit gamma